MSVLNKHTSCYSTGSQRPHRCCSFANKVVEIVGRWQVSACLQTRASARRGKWGQLTPWKNGWKIKKWKHAKKSSFLCSCYILRAIRAGRCRERRYADHIFIQIYFRMHHFVGRTDRRTDIHTDRQTDRQTDRPRYICNNRPHLCYAQRRGLKVYRTYTYIICSV